eukprot:scaffold36853_cov66-Phaeocystis_antarctica.AAC.1
MSRSSHADRPVAVAQAEVLAHHIEAAALQRVGGRHGQGLAAGLRDGGVALRDAELQALPGVADEAVGHGHVGRDIRPSFDRGNERIDHGGVDRIDEELLLVSRALQSRALIGGRRRRERGRCCWPRPYLGADANAEGGEEEKGTTHLRQHLDREAADIVGKIDTICTLQSILATAFGRVVTADLRRGVRTPLDR